jgi:hypothetical protein
VSEWGPLPCEKSRRRRARGSKIVAQVRSAPAPPEEAMVAPPPIPRNAKAAPDEMREARRGH